MSKPSEHKTVQARILAYAQEIGWTLVSRAEAERRRGGTEPGLSSPGLGEGEDTGRKTRAPLPPRIAGNRDFPFPPSCYASPWARPLVVCDAGRNQTT